MQEIFDFNSFFRKKIYLITGSSSYLAKPVVNFLLNKGSIVVCIGRVNSFKRKNLSVLDYLLKTNQYDEFVFLLSVYLNYNQEKKFNSSLKYFQTLSNSKFSKCFKITA